MQKLLSDKKLKYNGQDVRLNVVEANHRAQIELLWKRLVKLEKNQRRINGLSGREEYLALETLAKEI